MVTVLPFAEKPSEHHQEGREEHGQTEPGALQHGVPRTALPRRSDKLPHLLEAVPVGASLNPDHAVSLAEQTDLAGEDFGSG
jgi:hypothetical protein